MIFRSGRLTSVEQINIRKGSKSSTTRTRSDDISLPTFRQHFVSTKKPKTLNTVVHHPPSGQGVNGPKVPLILNLFQMGQMFGDLFVAFKILSRLDRTNITSQFRGRIRA